MYVTMYNANISRMTLVDIFLFL